MHQPHTENWQVGDWTVLPGLNRIDRNGESHKTTPKALATLLFLAEHQGAVVTREMLFETVWAGTIVSDDALNRVISDLRHIFGDSPQQPEVIETIRRKGYRLLLPAYPIEPSHPSPRSRPAQKKTHLGYLYWGIGCAVLLVGILGFSLTHFIGTSPASTYRAVPLTTSPGFEFDVAISYDGEQVAYIGWSENSKQMDLFVKQVGVETPQQLTDDARIEISPGWSPDGRAIAFLAGEKSHGPCHLIIMKVPGGDEQKAADCQTLLVTGVSWSPDGNSIVFSDRANRDEPFRIYELNVQTREVTPITDPPKGGYGDYSATYSPDGLSVAFIRGTVASTTALILAPAVGDLRTIDLESGYETRLTFDNQEMAHIDWMPDGKHIIFASQRELGTPGLWKIPHDGGDPEWLLGDNAFIRMPMLARHKNRLVFEQWDNDVSIWKISLDSLKQSQQSAYPLIHSTHVDATPQFSPDGKHIVFTSRRSGASEIWISDAEGNQPLQLTSFRGPFTSTPRWSPDGSQLTFETRTNGQADIYVIDSNGGQPRQLTSHPLQDMAPNWSPNGEWVYFGSNRSGEWQIWKSPSQGGESSQVTTQGGFFAMPAQHDNMLYYTRLDTSGIFKKPLSGGPEQLALPGLHHDDWGNWVVSEQGIYFLRRFPSRLSFFHFDSEQVDDLGALRQVPGGMVGLTISPDEQSLAFVQQRHSNADLWIVDNF